MKAQMTYAVVLFKIKDQSWFTGTTSWVTKVIPMYGFIELHQDEVNDSKVVFPVNTAVKTHSSLSGFGKETFLQMNYYNPFLDVY